MPRCHLHPRRHGAAAHHGCERPFPLEMLGPPDIEGPPWVVGGLVPAPLDNALCQAPNAPGRRGYRSGK